MALDVSRLTEELKKLVPHVRFYLDEAYGAGDSDAHRILLRQKIADLTGDPSVVDLSKLPTPQNHHVSVSHCRGLGGFALSEKPVGFDIEETARVRWELVERMSHVEDQKGPWPAAHWAAKESAFKSLGKNQPTVLSEIAVTSWTPLGPCQTSFHTPQGSGIALEFGSFTLAVFQPVSI